MKKFTLVLMLLALTAMSSLSALAQDDKTVTILYWQAASTVNPYLSGGTKDIDASAIVLEPLASYTPDGMMIPRIAADIPTVENGGVAEDLMSITWTIKEGIMWSDGTPVTSADVVWTANYCMNEETGCARAAEFSGISSVEAVDDSTVTINFEAPTPFPYLPFVGAVVPVLNSTQFEGCEGANAQSCSDQNFMPSVLVHSWLKTSARTMLSHMSATRTTVKKANHTSTVLSSKVAVTQNLLHVLSSKQAKQTMLGTSKSPQKF
jgi:peptide/nickel transport system substrate-binding protein